MIDPKTAKDDDTFSTEEECLPKPAARSPPPILAPGLSFSNLRQVSVHSITSNREELCTPRNAPLMAILGFSVFLCFVMVSMIGPFMPDHLRSLGANTTANGLMFSLYPAIYIPSSLLAGVVIQSRGGLPVLVFGILLLGGASIGFGLLKGSLYWLFVMRGLQGIGSSAVTSSVFCLSLIWFSEGIRNIVVGLNEGILGLAFMAGPVIGSLLFGVGGFELPFLAVGCGILGMLPLMLIFMWIFEIPFYSEIDEHGRDSSKQPLLLSRTPTSTVESHTKPAVFRDVLTRNTWVGSLSSCLVNLYFGFYNSSIAIYLEEKFNIPGSKVGFIFLVTSAFYGLMSPLVGYLTNHGYKSRSVMILGCVVSGLGFILLGPVPFIPEGGPHWLEWTVLIAANIFIGFGAACMNVPALPLINNLLPENLKNRSEGLVSGFFNALTSAGEAIGPLLASQLIRTIGFAWGAAILGVIVLVYAPFMWIF
eukprot:23544_1